MSCSAHLRHRCGPRLTLQPGRSEADTRNRSIHLSSATTEQTATGQLMRADVPTPAVPTDPREPA
jgi:hypothetical protein